jgi:hypothetical protein
MLAVVEFFKMGSDINALGYDIPLIFPSLLTRYVGGDWEPCTVPEVGTKFLYFHPTTSDATSITLPIPVTIPVTHSAGDLAVGTQYII